MTDVAPASITVSAAAVGATAGESGIKEGLSACNELTTTACGLPKAAATDVLESIRSLVPGLCEATQVDGPMLRIFGSALKFNYSPNLNKPALYFTTG